jgi:hypothetical protein
MNKDQKLEQFKQLWESITPDLIPQLEETFDDYAIKLTEFLILSILEDEDFEIGILNDDEASMISYDIYNMDKHLTLYYKSDTSWVIVLHLEDYDGNEKDFISVISEEESSVIPIGLKNLMKETLKKGEPQAIQANSLKSK